MRVLHVLQTLRGGGAETLVRELLPRLHRRGVEVGALCGYESGLADAEIDQLSFPVVSARKTGRFDLSFGLRMRREIRRFHPDIVHTHTATGKYWGRACAIAAGVPHIVHTEHSPAPELASWERPLTRLLLPATRTFLTFSDRTREFVRLREPVPPLTVIPNGIEIPALPTSEDRESARAALNVSDGTVVFGIVANLQPKKNQAFAINAFSRLAADDRASARLDIFGRGPEEHNLRELAAALGIANRVHFWGFRSDVRTLLAGLDVMVTVATVEAAPISLLEAMGARLPIIGTPHHGTLDMIVNGETGIVLRDWSVDSLTSALEFALHDPAWRLTAGAAGRKKLEDSFDIEAVTDAHVALYRSILDKTNAQIFRRPA